MPGLPKLPSIGSMPHYWFFMGTGILIGTMFGARMRNSSMTRGQFLRLVLRSAAIIYPIIYVWDACLTAYYKSEGWVAVLFPYLSC